MHAHIYVAELCIAEYITQKESLEKSTKSVPNDQWHVNMQRWQKVSGLAMCVTHTHRACGGWASDMIDLNSSSKDKVPAKEKPSAF